MADELKNNTTSDVVEESVKETMNPYSALDETVAMLLAATMTMKEMFSEITGKMSGTTKGMSKDLTLLLDSLSDGAVDINTAMFGDMDESMKAAEAMAKNSARMQELSSMKRLNKEQKKELKGLKLREKYGDLVDDKNFKTWGMIGQEFGKKVADAAKKFGSKIKQSITEAMDKAIAAVDESIASLAEGQNELQKSLGLSNAELKQYAGVIEGVTNELNAASGGAFNSTELTDLATQIGGVVKDEEKFASILRGTASTIARIEGLEQEDFENMYTALAKFDDGGKVLEDITAKGLAAIDIANQLEVNTETLGNIIKSGGEFILASAKTAEEATASMESLTNAALAAAQAGASNTLITSLIEDLQSTDNIEELSAFYEKYGLSGADLNDVTSKIASGDYSGVATLIDAIKESGANNKGLQSMMAERFGMKMSEMQNLINTEVSALDSMANISVNAGGAAADAIAKSNEALAGSTTLADKMTNLLSGAGGFGEFSKELSNAGVSMGDVVGDFKSMTAAGMPPWVAGIVSALKPMLKIIVNDLLGSDPEFVSALQEVMSIAGEVIGVFMGALKDFAPAIKDVLLLVGDAVKDIMPFIKTVLGMVSNLLKDFMPIVKDIAGLIGGLLQELMPIVSDILGSIMPVISEVFGAVSNLIKKLMPVFKQLFEFVGKIFGIVGKMIEKLMPVVSKVLVPVMNIVGKLINAFSGIFDIVGDIFDMLMDVFNDIIDPIMGAVDIIMEVVVIIFGIVAPLIKMLMSLLRQILLPIMDVVKVIMGFFGDILGTVVAIIQPIITMLSKLGIIEMIVNLVGKLFRALQYILEPILNIFTFMMNLIKENQVLMWLLVGAAAALAVAMAWAKGPVMGILVTVGVAAGLIAAIAGAASAKKKGEAQQVVARAEGGLIDTELWTMNEKGNPEMIYNAKSSGSNSTVLNASHIQEAVRVGFVQAVNTMGGVPVRAIDYRGHLDRIAHYEQVSANRLAHLADTADSILSKIDTQPIATGKSVW